MKRVHRILFNVGMFMLMLGVLTADSENLILPALLAVVGSVLMLIESKSLENEKQEEVK